MNYSRNNCENMKIRAIFFALLIETMLGVSIAFEFDADIGRLISGLSAVEKNRQGSIAATMDQMNRELLVINQASAVLEWQGATAPSKLVSSLNSQMSRFKTSWRNDWCTRLERIQKSATLDFSYQRMIHLLCRGPKYTPYQARALSNIFEQLASSYATAEVCRREENNVEKCYHGEPDLERLMTISRNETELRWAWISWRNEMSKVEGLFTTSVTLQNIGARNNGYDDIGECWREELESFDLEGLIDDLYAGVESLYELLHAVVRFRLTKLYPEIVDPRGPIPAHLLGNMWSQNWESLLDIVWPGSHGTANVTKSLKDKNFTVEDMVRRGEDFYVSMGFPPLSGNFWAKSIFEKGNNSRISCHGTAANMYRRDDYRILMCAEVSAEDFYVVHHELGHIQYYMAYKHQPAIFMDGANSAFHEAVGDAIMHGVMTPQHLQRLGLITDSILDDDLPFLLRQALAKIPQLPHSLVMDKWRWNVFNGNIEPSAYNRDWWALSRRYQGIEPPVFRSDEFFDPASKFHIADNTPYVRYFLAQILQVQLFKGMCEAAITGKVGDPNFRILLHRCDIYGSKDAGKKLKLLMELGSSVDWKYALYAATGSTNYDVEPLLQYYKPIRRWLERQVQYYNIPVGWDKTASNMI